jgi:hypothetical protein
VAFLFPSYATAHLVGDNTAGDGGYLVLWESPERLGGMAKIASLGERLSAMRGSILHMKVSPFYLGGLAFVHQACRARKTVVPRKLSDR